MKNNHERIVTGIGVSQYAYLTSPDTRFDEVGHYKTNLIMSGEDAENLKQKIDAAIRKALLLLKRRLKAKT